MQLEVHGHTGKLVLPGGSKTEAVPACSRLFADGAVATGATGNDLHVA